MKDIEKNLAELAREAAAQNAAMHKINLCAAGEDVEIDERQRLAEELREALQGEANAADRLGKFD